MDLPDANDLPPAHFLTAAGPARGQMELDAILAEVEAKEEKEGKRGTYTAERFQQREPRRYELIIAGLARGESKQRLAVAFGVAWETVRAIELKEVGGTLRDQKKKFADGLAGVIELGIDGLRTKAKAGKLSALDVAVLSDKWLLLEGEATSIVETRGEDPAVTAYLEHVRQMGLQAADEFAKGGSARPVAGVVVEMEPESGAGGVKPPAEDVQPVDDQH